MVLMTSLPILRNGRFLVFNRVVLSVLLLKNHFLLKFENFEIGKWMFVGVHAPVGFNSELLQRYTSLKLSYSEACDFPTLFHSYLFTRNFFCENIWKKSCAFLQGLWLDTKNRAGPLNKTFIKARRFHQIVVIKY